MINNLNMISNIFERIKSYQYPLFLAVCIGLISFISYNLGQISYGEKGKLGITENLPVQAGANIYSATQGKEEGTIEQAQNSSPIPTKVLDMRVVVSKASDSKKYHYSWCGTWKRITAKNQLWFNSDKEAEAAGYTLAGNCSK